MNPFKGQIVLASGNAGKLAEFQHLLTPLQWTVQPQSDFGIGATLPEAEEAGLTFIENAIIKARYAAKVSGLPAIADDSGLAVDYLQGAPGIYSSRYAGAEASAADNNQKLLTALQGVPSAQRSARFHCVLVYLHHAADPIPIIAHGIWDGYIIEEALGHQGFGYDPLFFVPSEHCTAAELDKVRKNQLSHRFQALQQLMSQLKALRQ